MQDNSHWNNQINHSILFLMQFIDRKEEWNRLQSLISQSEGGFGVVWGRRRVGKTRLLLEWSRKNKGLYLVGDQSSATIQRDFFAKGIEARFPGFASVQYPSWESLFERLIREAKLANWHGPLIIDEFPYLVETTPGLESLLQRLVDHEIKSSGLNLVIAGSNQRMMQGLVLGQNAPLYGRARELMQIQPLKVGFLKDAFPSLSDTECIHIYSMFGGIPRYWELVFNHLKSDLETIIDQLVLNPLGPLHNEPNRLLLEETPTAISLRPILDAIGQGAHRGSEIASRAGISSTSISKPLARLMEMGLVERELPFGESEKSSKRALYKIRDPFLRLWFKVVASNRSVLMQSPAKVRKAIYQKHAPILFSQTWEDLCKQSIPRLHSVKSFNNFGNWLPAKRYWRGNEPELDIVAQSLDGKHFLLGECKWLKRPATSEDLGQIANQLFQKGLPRNINMKGKMVSYVVFVNDIKKGHDKNVQGVTIVKAADVVSCLRD